MCKMIEESVVRNQISEFKVPFGEDAQDGQVTVKSLSRKRCLYFICSIGCVLLAGLIVFLYIEGFLRPLDLPCSHFMSPAHSKNRTVNTKLCINHDRQTDVDLIKSTLGANNPDQVLPFVVIGDFGRDGFCCQRDVAIEMDRIGAAIKAKFVINTGDSFYENGILNVTDEEVQTSWADVYNQDYIATLDWWSVLGNHDYRGSSRALMELSKVVAPRFLIPDRWWSRVVSRPNGQRPVRFIMIDTSPMISNYQTEEPSMRNHDGGIDPEFERVEEQMKWLEDQLKIPNEVKIVVGHHPAFSYMYYGTEDRSFLESRVVDLLERYHVLAYFAGHDHNLQFAQPRFQSTSYFVSGAGSRLRDGQVNARPEDVHFYTVVHGFLACTILGDEMRVVSVDMYGKMMNAVVVP